MVIFVEGPSERRVDTKLGESQSRDFREAGLGALFAKLLSSVDSLSPVLWRQAGCTEWWCAAGNMCLWFLRAKITTGVHCLCLTLGLSVLTNMICCLQTHSVPCNVLSVIHEYICLRGATHYNDKFYVWLTNERCLNYWKPTFFLFIMNLHVLLSCSLIWPRLELNVTCKRNPIYLVWK